MLPNPLSRLNQEVEKILRLLDDGFWCSEITTRAENLGAFYAIEVLQAFLIRLRITCLK